jgi:chaperonin cofactor prefoldin
MSRKIVKYIKDFIRNNFMRFNDFFESVRMGKRELLTPPKKDYTIGFEFEILSDGDNYDPSDMYERFSEDWHNNNDADFEKYFNDVFMTGRKNIAVLNRDLGFKLQPKYGWASEYDFHKTNRKRFHADGLIAKYPELEAEIKEINKISNDVNKITDQDELNLIIKRVFALITYDKSHDSLTDTEKSEVEQTFSRMKKKQDISHYIYNLPNELRFIDDMNYDKDESSEYYWTSEDKTTLNAGIDTLDDIINYFTDDGDDIDVSDIETYLDQEYYEWIDAQIDADFQEYMQYNSGYAPVNEIADQLETFVDKGIIKHTQYHESSKNVKMWTVEPDSSIKGAEVVSPVFDNLNEAFINMHKVFEMINIYFDTDNTTGLHVNIGTFGSEELEKIDLLKFLLIVGGENILKDFDRENNTYTIDNMESIYSWLSGETMSKFGFKRINTDIIKYAQKHRLFNFEKLQKYGYIEVRGFGNVGYEKKGHIIENYIRKILRALDIAMDPNAYKQTYMKYLAKAITKANPSHFTLSEIRSLDSYKKEFVRLSSDQSFRFKPHQIEKSIVDSYGIIINLILNESEFDMVLPKFYSTLSTIHSVMKNKDSGDYRKSLSVLIRDYKYIITEFRNLSSKKRNDSENNRLELITPIAKILKILVS